jgi:hypothetical protein
MRKITSTDLALLQELNNEFARLSGNMSILLDKILSGEIGINDTHAAHVKELGNEVLARVMGSSFPSK